MIENRWMSSRAWFLPLPLLFIMVLIIGWPFLWTLWTSFTDARLIAPIFHHNRLDLIAMVELLIALVEGGDEERVESSRGAGAMAGGGSGKGAVDV